MLSDKPVLVTGGAGFIGANLASRLVQTGYRVLIYDALYRPGVEANLAWLRSRYPHGVQPIVADINDDAALVQAVAESGVVFHLAAQVAVTSSLDDPQADFATNVQGSVAVLEAIRRTGRTIPLIFASTNKVYGDLADVNLVQQEDVYVPSDPLIRQFGVSEERPLDFHTPYGCSKGAADQYVLDYARSFGLATAVLRMSCIYGPLQRGTEDQGWVAHFLLKALAGETISVYGDGRQVRDLLFVDDAVDAYIAAWRHMEAVRGSAFNLGGGPANAVSLRQVIRAIETLIGRRVLVHHSDWRPGDQRYYVSDTRRAARALHLSSPRPWLEGLRALADWMRREATPAEALS